MCINMYYIFIVVKTTQKDTQIYNKLQFTKKKKHNTIK